MLWYLSGAARGHAPRAGAGSHGATPECRHLSAASSSARERARADVIHPALGDQSGTCDRAESGATMAIARAMGTSVSVMRFTVVDRDGTMSFVAPCHALKVLAAACSRRPADHRMLIALAADYDARLAAEVRDGLSLFDEHNVPGDARAIHIELRERAAHEAPPFRVVDELTRRRSLEPVRAGLVVFNLKARRIVQIQNSYADLLRRDRGRIRRDGRPTRALYRYELPADWSIVP